MNRKQRKTAPPRDPLEVALRFFALRARSAAEVRRALVRPGVPSAVVEATLATLTRQGYVDDAAFVALWHRGIA